MSLSNSISISLVSPLVGGGYDPMAAEYFSRISSQPDGTRKRLINGLASDLKRYGLIQYIDFLQLRASHAAQAARLNLIEDAYNATAVGSPAFTVDAGYKGDGSAAYMNNNFNPSDGLKKYQLNSCHFGVVSRTSGAVNAVEIGARASSTTQQSIVQINFNSFLQGRANQDSAGTAVANSNGTGHFIVSRTSSSLVTFYRNGASIGTNSTTSTSIANLNFYDLAVNTGGTAASFSTRELSVVHAGAGLSAQAAADLSGIIEDYLTAIGAWV